MAAGVLAFFRAGLRVASFDRLRRLARASRERRAINHAEVSSTSQLVTRAAAGLPGVSSCLSQALAMSFLLARRSIHSRLVLGVARGPEGHRFHAWLECNDLIVIGAEDAGECVRLAVFE